LASFGRVIRFNMRGEGLSDAVSPRDRATLEQRAEDMVAVLDVVGSEQAALLGGIFGGCGVLDPVFDRRRLWLYWPEAEACRGQGQAVHVPRHGQFERLLVWGCRQGR
jgi:pimeloyl-ACP methyl ester carboxylesterase